MTLSNVPLDALMFPLQIINGIQPLSLTIHGVNTHFIHHQSNVKNYLIGHKWEEGQPKKEVVLSCIFLHLSANSASKFKIPIATAIV